MIQFYDDDHKARYEDLMQRMAAEDWDTNRAAFAYLVTLDTVCRDHIGRIRHTKFNLFCIL